jgi:hypothetical protein
MWCSIAGFIVTLTLSMLAVPLVAGAQPVGKVPTIGFLTHNAATQTTQAFEAFAQGLRELGYIEGQTMTIERRYAEGRLDRVPALVADLAARHIDVFVVTNNLIAKAVQQTTPQSPIVMLVAEEPVSSGLVQSLAHPGGTITGMAMVPGAAIYGKNLEFLKEALPPGSRIGVLFNATAENAHYLHVTEEVAQGLQVTLVLAEVRSTEDFEAGSCIATLRLIPLPQNQVQCPHLSICGRGQRHGITSCFLSAHPLRTPLARRHLAPHPAQVPGDGSSHANGGARAPHTPAPPRERAQTLRGPDAQASLCLV